ncbi:TolC family protein [Candidatus Neomarinimicrobiota bacterium]
MFTMKSYLKITIMLGFLAVWSNAQTITLDDFLALARVNHPLFEKEALSGQIEGQGRDAYLGAQDWRIASSPSFVHQTPLATSSFSPKRVDQMSTGASLEKTFWSTGGRLSLSWTSDMTDQELDDIVIPFVPEPLVISPGPPQFYQNSINLSYTQPLLQNFRGALDRLGYEIGQYVVDMVNIQAQENQEEFLLDLASRFIDWVLLDEQRKIAQERLSLTEQQLEQAQRKRDANLIDEVDVLRSEDAVRLAEQGVVLLDAQWRAKQAELSVLSRSSNLLKLTPAFDLYERLDRVALSSAGERLRQQSRLLRVLSIQRQQMERQQQGLYEILKPQLHLSAQVAAKSGNSEFGSSLGFNNSDAGLFLQFSYPLGNRSALAEAEKTRLQIERHDLEVDEIVLGLEAVMQNLILQIEGMEQVLALNEKQIETACLRTEEELKMYNQGRGDLTFVIQSQDNEERALLTYAQNSAAYQGLNLRLNALLDELLPTTEQKNLE